MQSSVTNRQMMFLIFIVCAALSTVTISHMMALSAGRGAWFTLLLTSLVFGVLTAVIIKLNQMYEGKTLFEYSRDIMGRFMPYILGIFYILYFLIFDTAVCNTLSNVVHAHFLLETPRWALILILIPVLGYIANKGVNKAGRLAEIFLLWFLAVSVFIFITMLFQGRWNYLLPLFNASDVGQYVFSIKDAYPAFAGIGVLTVIPMGKNNKKAPKAMFFTMIALGIFYILDVYGCYALIGLDEIVYHSYPLIDAIRLVEYESIEFFQRIDILYMTFGFIRIFIGKGIIYLAVVEYLCKLLPKAKRITIVIWVGVVVALTSISSLGISNISEILYAVVGYSSVVAVFLIPLTLLIIAKVKRHGKKSD